MRLAFTNGLLKTTHFDDEMRQLADRHYTRRPGSVGKRQFCYSGRKLVLRDASGLVCFVWMWPQEDKRMDSQLGYNCAIFRNEGPRLSSEIILEAEQHAIAKWGERRAYTFVDSRKIQSSHPGYCFLKAGWDYQRDEKRKHVLSQGGKHILEKLLRVA